MNGDEGSPRENGSSKQVSESVDKTDKMIPESEDSSSKTLKSDNSSVDISEKDGVTAAADEAAHKEDVASGKSLKKVAPKHTTDAEGADITVDKIHDANGEAKKEEVGKEEKEKGSLPERRMSLRPRATPKKYKDTEISSDEEGVKDPLATRDPLAIPSNKNATAVLIRKSPTTVTTPKVGSKAPIKLTKLTRPPPELIKAPLSNKISISPATTVTVVPRSRENTSSKSGFVIVDTQSILTGKGPVAVSSVPASVTVSAVPSLSTVRAQTKLMPASVLAPKKAALVQPSLPDPFESLGTAFKTKQKCKRKY